MERIIKLIKQLFAFGIVGVLCFLIDYGLMITLTDFAGINYIISCAISFVVSNIVNYILCMSFVFDSGKKKNKKEFIVFAALSIVGLLLTELFMYAFVNGLNINYKISKVIVTAIVMCYNFISRKIVFERGR